MTGETSCEDARGLAGGQLNDGLASSGRLYNRWGVPRWIAVSGCGILVLWACMRVYDHQHPAAPSARRLWSLRQYDRIAAIKELEGSGRVDTDVAIPALIRALQDTDGEVRAAAAMALVSAIPGAGGETGPSAQNVRAVLKALIKVLDDPQPAVRAAATRALWMVVLVNQVPAGQADFEPATNALVERLDDPDQVVRLAAIQGMGAVGPKLLGEPTARLVAAMNDSSEKHRDAAVEALAVYYSGLPPLIPALVEAAERADAPVRASYLKLLGRVRPRSFSGEALSGLITALGSKDGEIVAVAASDVLAFAEAASSRTGSNTHSAVRPLIAALGTWLARQAGDPSKPDPAIAITESLARIAPATQSSDLAVAALNRMLRAGDTRRRVKAAVALSRFPPGAGVFTALTDMIGDRDVAVRLAVLLAIHDVHFGAPFVIPKEMGTALEDDSAEVRKAAAAALWGSGVGIDAYVPALIRHAELDPSERVREVCEGTLQHAADSRAVTAAVLPELIRAQASDHAALRFLASELLSGLGSAAAPAVPALIRSLERSDGTKPWANPAAGAAKALGRITPRTAMAAMAIKALIAALRVEDAEVKIAVVTALTAFGPEAMPAVLSVVQVMNESRSQEHDLIAIESAGMLAKIGSHDVRANAIVVLRELAEKGKPFIREAAARSLKDLEVVD